MGNETASSGGFFFFFFFFFFNVLISSHSNMKSLNNKSELWQTGIFVIKVFLTLSLWFVKSPQFIGCLTSGSRIFYSYGDVTFGDDELQNQDISSTSLTFEQGGISIVSQQV